MVEFKGDKFTIYKKQLTEYIVIRDRLTCGNVRFLLVQVVFCVEPLVYN